MDAARAFLNLLAECAAVDAGVDVGKGGGDGRVVGTVEGGVVGKVEGGVEGGGEDAGVEEGVDAVRARHDDAERTRHDQALPDNKALRACQDKIGEGDAWVGEGVDVGMGGGDGRGISSGEGKGEGGADGRKGRAQRALDVLETWIVELRNVPQATTRERVEQKVCPDAPGLRGSWRNALRPAAAQCVCRRRPDRRAGQGHWYFPR